MERHPNNVGGGSAFFFSLFFPPAYAGVKFIDKSTRVFFFFFFSRNFLQTETNSGKLLITVPAHLVCIKRGTGATLGFLPDFQEMLQHFLLYH